MTSFTITRPGPEADSSILKKKYTFFQHTWIPSEQHANSEQYNSIMDSYESNAFLPVDIYPVHYDYSDSKTPLFRSNINIDPSLDLYDWGHVDSYLPGKDTTSLYNNTEVSMEDLSTTTYPSINFFDEDSKHFFSLLPEDKTASVGGILTWQQSIPPERDTKYNSLSDFKNSYKSPKSSTSPILSPLITDGVYQTQAKRQRLSRSADDSTNIYSTDSSISESRSSSISFTSNQPFYQNRKRSDSFERYIYTDSSSKDSLRSPMSDEGFNEYVLSRTDTENYMASGDLPSAFPKPFNGAFGSPQDCQMLLAMPRRQKQRYDGDYYTPKWVRYTGHLKEGYCDSCHPGKWLQLKNSAYWYHKQFYHGVSSVTGKPFRKPIEQRLGKGSLTEGLCHHCKRFVPVCNSKKKNNYMLWYRHAHKCHLNDKSKPLLK